jgi:5,10-methylenetetrahydrofolate reductase
MFDAHPTSDIRHPSSDISCMSLLSDALKSSNRFLLNVEMCPPRTDVPIEQSVEAWIDSNRLMRKISALGRFIFMTDGAIGRREEPNLRHVTINLGPESDRSYIVPILTTKHTLDYCLEFAERSYSLGFPSLVVLGGDKSDNERRCVEHAYELRRLIRQRVPGLTLGGWASPHGGRRQVEYILDPEYSADFYMAQITSHYQPVDEFLNEAARLGVKIPGVFGVFFYRSANPKTLGMLSKFIPVPVGDLQRDFAAGILPEEICARSIHALLRRGVKNVYISNLPMASATQKFTRIESRVEEMLVIS